MITILHKKSIGVLTVLATIFMTACGSSDDPKVTPDPTPDPTPEQTSSRCVYTTPSGSGIVISKLQYEDYMYDAQGRMTAFTDDGLWSLIDYSLGTITDYYGNVTKFTLNSSNCVTSIIEEDSGNYREDDEIVYYNYKAIYNFGYSSDNYLTTATFTWEENEVSASGEIIEDEKLKVTANYTWDNGSLTKAVYNGSGYYMEEENGELVKEEYNDILTATIQNSLENELLQYTVGFCDYIIQPLELSGTLPAISGLFGNAPLRLPSMAIMNETENGVNAGNSVMLYTYTFNDDKSVKEESLKEDNYSADTYKYTYSIFSEAPNNGGNGNQGGNQGGGSGTLGGDKKPKGKPMKLHKSALHFGRKMRSNSL